MIVRIHNPKRRRRIVTRRKCHRAAVKLGQCAARSRGFSLRTRRSRKARRVHGKRRASTGRRRARSASGRFVSYASRMRRSVRRRSGSHLKYRGRADFPTKRKSNPSNLMLLNPRRRRRSRRYGRFIKARHCNQRRSRSRRRNCNPSNRLRLGTYVNRTMIKEIGMVIVGFAAARIVRDQLNARLLPAGSSRTTEAVFNIGTKVLTAVLGGFLVAKMNRSLARGFSIGALTSAGLDVLALATGKAMSMNEYVAPRSMARLSGVGRMTNSGRGMQAYAPAFAGAWGKAW